MIRDGKRITLQVRIDELTLGSAAEASRSRGALAESFGLELADRRPDGAPAGPVVSAVEPRGPAAQAAVRPGDVILEVNRTRVRTAGEAAAQFSSTKPGGVALVLLSRDGQNVFVTVKREN